MINPRYAVGQKDGYTYIIELNHADNVTVRVWKPTDDDSPPRMYTTDFCCRDHGRAACLNLIDRLNGRETDTDVAVVEVPGVIQDVANMLGRALGMDVVVQRIDGVPPVVEEKKKILH